MLLISTELEEILDLSHRIVVISNGRIVGEMVSDDVDLERLGLLMTGATVDDRGRRVSDLGTASTTIDEERPEVVAQARERSRRGVTAEVVGLYVVCIGTALALAAILVAATGGSWADVYTAMLDGSHPERRAASGSRIGVATPILLVSLGTIVSGRAGLVNIGQEGQLVIGLVLRGVRRGPTGRAGPAGAGRWRC